MPRRNTHPFKRTLEGQQGMMSLFRSQRVLALLCLTFIALLNFGDCGNDLCVGVVSRHNIDRAGKTSKILRETEFLSSKLPWSVHNAQTRSVFSLFFFLLHIRVGTPQKSLASVWRCCFKNFNWYIDRFKITYKSNHRGFDSGPRKRWAENDSN